MKRSSKFLSFSLPFIILSVMFLPAGCKKDRIETLNAYDPISTYLDSKKQQEQEFIIDSAGSGPIVGNQGTQIWISKQCLMFPNGDSVTWPFTIKLVELYKPKDMIYYQMPTVAGGTILKTEGEIRLRAFKGATELVLKPDPCMAQIAMPNAAPQAGMRVFYGFDSNGKPDWNDDPAYFGISTTISPTFTTTAYGYQASIARLGWINCGSLAGSSNNSTITFTSSTDDLTNVGIFIYFPSTKTVMQAYNSASGLIPNGSSVKIVAIGIDSGGNLFSFTQSQTVNTSSPVDIVMSATTDAALTSYLDGL